MIDFMKRIIIYGMLCTTVLSVTACEFRRPDRVDGKVVLNEMESPEVEGFDATLLKSAKEAEKKSEHERAAQFYAQLIDRDKDNVSYLLGFAENSRRSGKLAAAISAYEAMLLLKPDHISAMEGKGLALLDKGEFDLSGEVLTRVMEKDPKRWRTLNGMAILFVMQEMYSEAMAYFTEALTQKPNYPPVLNNVGLTLAINGKTDGAIQALQKAAQFAGSSPKLREKIELNLAMVYGVAGKLDRAKATAGRHLSGPALHNNLGFYAHLAKDDVLAKSYLNMALMGSPRHYERAWTNLDRLEKQENKADQKHRMGKRVVVK